jgi:putative transposase
VRKRERVLQRFKSAEHAQAFLEPFSAVCNQFRSRRHRLSAHHYREIMRDRFTWHLARCHRRGVALLRSVNPASLLSPRLRSPCGGRQLVNPAYAGGVPDVAPRDGSRDFVRVVRLAAFASGLTGQHEA